ncbi:hypothetical protein [Clostridium akagii]|uniref:hypothetical protein n=1 Tax=Clostridium akagii TaxID=91623 RepID=UPI00047CB04B|nr:hypothetical protein [Clostridium akagii]
MCKNKVFLSYSKPFRNDQIDFLDKLKNYLNSIDLKPICLEQIHYSYKSPLEPILEIIDDSKGTIVIPFERFHSYVGYSKEDSRENKEIINSFYSSPWTQIEAGITYSKKKPLLILKPNYILQEGIIDDKTNDYYQIFVIECKKINNRFVMQSFESNNNLKNIIKTWSMGL